jgi:hypothetical protein
MRSSSEHLLTTTEGVDEGSAASTVEESGAEGSALGATAAAGAEDESTPAPPDDMETSESRAAREERGTGQQLQAGEG